MESTPLYLYIYIYIYCMSSKKFLDHPEKELHFFFQIFIELFLRVEET